MELNIFVVNAFVKDSFSGNPAAVVPLDSWISDREMQLIAMQNNLAETAFFVPNNAGFHLRWFTPVAEVKLCGHATLATAHVLFHHLDYKDDMVRFDSLSGPLQVKRLDNGQLELNFPEDKIAQKPNDPALAKALGTSVQETWSGDTDEIAVLSSVDAVLGLEPDFRALSAFGSRGVIATAWDDSDSDYDFVSRCFYPTYGIDEDPTTGSAHTSLTPLWHHKSGKHSFRALQASSRGGHLQCTKAGDRSLISGKAETYLSGRIVF